MGNVDSYEQCPNNLSKIVSKLNEHRFLFESARDALTQYCAKRSEKKLIIVAPVQFLLLPLKLSFTSTGSWKENGFYPGC